MAVLNYTTESGGKGRLYQNVNLGELWRLYDERGVSEITINPVKGIMTIIVDGAKWYWYRRTDVLLFSDRVGFHGVFSGAAGTNEELEERFGITIDIDDEH
jgi:hypothetical protein|nr:MAG TPA: hypothetical protein [Caudoviricetes sp.]